MVLEGHHGFEIADVLQGVIASYGIKEKVSAFQTNNASNNNMALAALTIGVPFDPKQSRVRCFATPLNF